MKESVMQKNKVLKVLIVTLIMLLLGIFCKMKTACAIKFNIYDPRDGQYYQVQVDNPLVRPLSVVTSELSKFTGLPKDLFLISRSDLKGKYSYYLELPINQVTKDGVLYNIYRNREVVVAGLADDNLENVVIASEINQQKVTRIIPVAFGYCKKIRSVTFEPNSAIISIGSECFSCCRLLSNITLPSSLKNISDLCFSGCSSLASITLPSSLKSIGDFCFSHCSLKNVILPNSITSIGDLCFSGCSSLASITLPSSLKSIGDLCFSHCSLKNVTLPNSLTSIGDNAFIDCTSLQQVKLGNDSQLKHLGNDIFLRAKIDEQKFRDRLDAIHQFQNAEKRRADRLASMINLTDQKYQEELHDIYSLFNRHCSTDDPVFAYEVLTQKIGYSLGEDHPDFIKMKQGRKYYAEQLSWIERERALEMMRIESYK